MTMRTTRSTGSLPRGCGGEVQQSRDTYFGRWSRDSRVAAALDSVDPMASAESLGESVAAGDGYAAA
jgi:hypothetical protein